MYTLIIFSLISFYSEQCILGTEQVFQTEMSQKKSYHVMTVRLCVLYRIKANSKCGYLTWANKGGVTGPGTVTPTFKLAKLKR